MDINAHKATLPEPEVLADQEKRAAWIIYQLKLRGLSLAALARQYKQSRGVAVSALRRPYPAWEFRIAKALGRKPAEIFPERYDANALPKTQIGQSRLNAQPEARVAS